MAYSVERCLLKELLRKRGMTQAKLAELMEISPQQIQHYVQTNRVMSLVVAKNISAILGCSIDDLYEWNNKE